MQNRDDLTRQDAQQTNQGPRSEGDSDREQRDPQDVAQAMVFWTNVLQRFKEQAESGTRKPGSPATP